MFNIKELKKTTEYWLENAQNEIYYSLKTYMIENELNQTELAKKLGFSKSYISQILSGEFNYSVKKFIELSLAINQEPVLKFKPLEEGAVVDECKVIDFKTYSIQNIKTQKKEMRFNIPINQDILINE